MDNSKFVNIYVYTIVDAEGKETYSFPFSSIDDDSAIRMIAHSLAYAAFYQKSSYSLCRVYSLCSVEYSKSFDVSCSTINDLFLSLNRSIVTFDPDVYQRDYDFFLSFLSKSSQNEEDKPNA